MEFWRKFARSYFDFCVFITIAFISILVLYIWFGLGEAGLGIIVLVGGALSLSIAFSAIGMFIELCDNIAEIKENAEKATSKPKKTVRKETQCSAGIQHRQ